MGAETAEKRIAKLEEDLKVSTARVRRWRDAYFKLTSDVMDLIEHGLDADDD
jgi:hypothetical protein